jgi:hypothetical protein
LAAIWKGLSYFRAVNVFHPNRSGFIPTSRFQRVDGYFGENRTKDMGQFAFRDSLSLTNVQGNMTPTDGLSGSVA